MRSTLPLVLVPALTTLVSFGAPIDIGDRRELLVDDYLIESTKDGLSLRLHHPVEKEISIDHNAPWEGTGCGYHSIFQDGDKYRMYYKAWHLDVQEGKLRPADSHFTCYAESTDGIHWVKPKLGLVEYPKGSGNKENNIVIGLFREPWMKDAKPDAVHPAIFKDANPDCPTDARYKAILRSRGEKGLLALKSPDGLRWSLLSEKPVITDGAFDSQNLAFWDPVRKEYRAYWRYFSEGNRAIRTATSRDMITWTNQKDLTYPGSTAEQLYTNQIQPYYRAPHLFVGFPTRYVERGWNKSMEVLPELEHRKLRSSISDRYGMAITEGLFMSSRDGVSFQRWPEAFLRPGVERPGTWHYGHQYIGWQIVETASPFQGAPNEMSLYATEGYWTGKSDQLRRYTMRLDGFVSANAPLSGGSFVTRPITFQGKELHLNFSSSAAGGIRVEIQDETGTAIPGYAKDDCDEVFGDTIDRPVYWGDQGCDVSTLSGKTVRLQFSLRDADLFAFQFQ
ncbi:MAG: hypothetical protein P1U87_13465 [Verrucomicrobiales bacterium]|nr:hypothetical protein [Verrucomicrobiales bacterium]